MIDSSFRRGSRARSGSSVDAPHAALLIDFDNVTMGIRSDLQNQLRKLMNSDIIKGKVSVQRAYADWRRYPQYIVPLSEASIDLIFAPAFGANKKNATDIRLAIDALELVFTRPEIGTFILLSGDSDFSALVLKLKEYGKYMIGVGIRESSSDLLIQNCDEYFSYNELTGLSKESDLEYVRRDPWELVVEAVQKMLRDGDVMRSDRLKQVMQAIDPKFDEKDVGFNRFSKFATAAAGRGLLSLTKMENGQFAIDMGSNANVQVSGEAGETSKEPAAGTRRRGGRKRSESRPAPASLTLSEGFGLLKQALTAAGALGDESTDHERIREQMIELHGSDSDPLFESRRFVRMLRQAHDADLIELIKSDGDQYQLKLSPTAVSTADKEQEIVVAAEAEPEAGKRKKTTKKAKKTVRRTTTRRSARTDTSTSPEVDAESSAEAGQAVTPADQSKDGPQGSQEVVKKAKKTTRRPRATTRRSTRSKESAETEETESPPVVGAEPADTPVAKKQATSSSMSLKRPSGGSSKTAGRSTRSRTGTAARTSDDDVKQDESGVATSEPAASQKTPKPNPRYRRGSHGPAPSPARREEDDSKKDEAPESRQKDERSQAASSSRTRTSGRRSVGMRRGSRGGRAASSPEPTPTGGDEPKQIESSAKVEVKNDGPVQQDSAPRGVLDQDVDAGDHEHGFLNRIRAAINKAVGGEAEKPGSED